MKRLVLLLLAVLLIAGSAVTMAESPNATTVVYSRSGLADKPKLSANQIAEQLYGISGWDKVYTAEPSISAPYATGALSPEYIQAAVENITVIRAVAGLSPVYADDDLCNTAQYGAVVLAANGVLTHYPEQPADMDDDFYQRGYSATTSSNIGYGHINNVHFDRSCMNDDDPGNSQMLGHRRWLLNPTLKYVGVGHAGTFYITKVFDKSGPAAEYDFIAWPPSGYCPNELISSAAPWSITLNPKVFDIPDNIDNMIVRVTRTEDGKSWVLDKNTGGSTDLDHNFFICNLQGYGVSNCFMFRVGRAQGWSSSAPSGEFSVSISGLVTKEGEPAELRYTTTLFSASEIPSEEIYTSGDFSYRLMGEEAEIVGWSGGSKALLIPDTLDGYYVRKIADDAEIDPRCTSITLPNTLEYIGAGAFDGCAAKGSISISSYVKHIGENAFANMQGVTEFIVSGGNSYFSSKDGVLFNKNMTTLINYPLASQRGLYMIPESVTQIQSKAFANAKGLTVLRVPSAAISAGADSFSGCVLEVYGSDKTELYRQISQATIQGELYFHPSSGFVEVSGLAIDVPDTLILGTGTPLACTITPVNATYPKLAWRVIAGSGRAEINEAGELIALTEGTVRLRVESLDGSGTGMEKTIVIIASTCTGIEIQADKTVMLVGNSLQLSIRFTPQGASEAISWSVVGNAATISAEGLLTAKAAGEVTVTARSASGLEDTIDITIVDYICGDSDFNGRVEAKDAAVILRHLVGLGILMPNGQLAADTNANGQVEAADAALILRYLVELEDSLPVR